MLDSGQFMSGRSSQTFGERLREARESVPRYKRNRPAFARDVGVTARTVQRWESGENKPRDFDAVSPRTAELCGVSQVWLETGFGAKRPHDVSQSTPQLGLPEVEDFLATKLGKSLSREVASALRAWPFGAMYMPHPTVKDIERQLSWIEMTIELKRQQADGDQGE
jgi:transcriptional regulator with XRE-family HTH domain